MRIVAVHIFVPLQCGSREWRGHKDEERIGLPSAVSPHSKGNSPGRVTLLFSVFQLV